LQIIAGAIAAGLVGLAMRSEASAFWET